MDEIKIDERTIEAISGAFSELCSSLGKLLDAVIEAVSCTVDILLEVAEMYAAFFRASNSVKKRNYKEKWHKNGPIFDKRNQIHRCRNAI